MIRMYNSVFIALALSCAITGCIEDNYLIGNYKGTFTVQYGSDIITNDAEVNFNYYTYSSKGYFKVVPIHGNWPVPAGGSGSYKISGNKITFYDQNYWLAYFDLGLVLNGEYSLSTVGNALKLVKIGGNGNYTYDLVKE